MLHIQDNFVPGSPISQVPSSWFNKVAKFINGLVPGKGINFDKTENGTTVINCDGLDAAMGTPVDNSGASTASDATQPFSAPFTNWECGGENGVRIRVYGIWTGDYAAHVLHPIDIEIAANGLVRSVKSVGDKSIEIGA